MKLTKQQEQIIGLLGDGLWHCGKEINDLFIKDDRKRISELKALGFQIIDQKCDMHKHPSGLLMRRMIGVPRKEGEVTDQPCCYSYAKFRVHDQQCGVYIKEKTNQGVLI